jgi:hypothetical protein
MSDVVEPAAPVRVRKGWDIGVTITFIVLTVVAGFAGAFISYLGLAFFGSCNSKGCSGQQLIDGGMVLIVLAALGIVASIVMLIIRRRGWAISLITLGVVVIGWIVLNVVDFR